MDTKTVGVKIDTRTRDRLKRLGRSRDRSPHWIMKSAIDRYLTEEEKFELEKAEDEARFQEYLDTGDAVDFDKADSWLLALSQGKEASWRD
jgi:predicted transcriptional regulator